MKVAFRSPVFGRCFSFHVLYTVLFVSLVVVELLQQVLKIRGTVLVVCDIYKERKISIDAFGQNGGGDQRNAHVGGLCCYSQAHSSIRYRYIKLTGTFDIILHTFDR